MTYRELFKQLSEEELDQEMVIFNSETIKISPYIDIIRKTDENFDPEMDNYSVYLDITC